MAAKVEIAAQRVNDTAQRAQQAKRELRRLLEERQRLSKHNPGVCGTPAGYRRHVKDATAPCYACLEAKCWEKRGR